MRSLSFFGHGPFPVISPEEAASAFSSFPHIDTLALYDTVVAAEHRPEEYALAVGEACPRLKAVTFVEYPTDSYFEEAEDLESSNGDIDPFLISGFPKVCYHIGRDSDSLKPYVSQ